MTREFVRPEDLHDLVAAEFGTDRHLTTLDRLTGGSKKGVYRLGLDDGTTVVLYVWAAGENYWPPSPVVPDDPFTDASGADLFAVAHAALTAADVPVPRLHHLDRTGRHLDADLALVEDVGGVRLETLLEEDPAAAAAPLATLGAALRRMHTTLGPHWGRLPGAPDRPGHVWHGGQRLDPETGEAPGLDGPAPGGSAPLGSGGRRPDAGTGGAPGRDRQDAQPAGDGGRRAEDVVVDRALGHLARAAERDARLAAARDQVAAHVHALRAAVPARSTYGLVHGELGPDHVFVTAAGEPVLIDIEGLTWFDVEWEHAWLQLRFRDAYPALGPVDLDPHRLELYRYAQVLSLVEGPLRIATTDFPDRAWMLELAEWNITKALAVL
jgi:aminoglycoside phosphotransferase (APT) family kinase protein